MRWFRRDRYDAERSAKTRERTSIFGSPIVLLAIWLVWAWFVSYLTCWVVSGLTAFNSWINSPDGYAFMSGQLVGFDKVSAGFAFTNFGNYATMGQNSILWWGLEAVLSLMMIPIFMKAGWKNRRIKHLEYGNDRLATDSEVLRQYPLIADRGAEFKGYGGVPISHFSNKGFWHEHPITWLFHHGSLQNDTGVPATGYYSIDPTNINSLIVGITRSGKGETLIFPLLDILSRAEEKSSMVVNDPKGENYQMSYKTLRKRGYNVQVLNIQNTDFSMSYNPLNNIIKFAQDGYFDEVQDAVNTLSSSIYVDPNEKDKFWQNSSINLLNALILAIIDYARRNNEWEKVTMDNALHMMTDLGSSQVAVDANGDPITDEETQAKKTRNRLSIYFDKLRKLNEHEYDQFRQMALDAFAQSNFAGEETAGNIYASALNGIKIYQQQNIAKLTSKNSVDFEAIGFPRTLKAKFPSTFNFATANVEFFDAETGKSLEKRTQLVDKVGRLDYTIKTLLPDSFKIRLDFKFAKNAESLQDKYVEITGIKKYKETGLGQARQPKLDPYTKKPMLDYVKLMVSKNNLGGELEEIEVNYSESPVALFLVTPPNNPSYNQLPAFAIDQIFNTIYSTALNNGRKAYNRVHFILDEFGNLPTIDKMHTKISIGLGQNLCFDIVVQNLEQLQINYSKDQASTIESNCANVLYVLTESEQTAKTISSRIGKRTAQVNSQSGKAFDVHSVNTNQNFVSQEILSPTELMRFQGGEMVVLRSVYRQDQKGHSVSAMPIFDHGDTRMPYRYTFLTKEFDDKTTLSDIGIRSEHRSLDLKKNRVNFDIAFSQLEFDNQPQSQPAPVQSAMPDPTPIEEPEESEPTPPQPATNEPKVDQEQARSYEFPDMSDLISTISDMPKDAVLTLEEIKNPDLTNQATQYLFSLWHDDSEKSRFVFDDTQKWWFHKRHNSWEKIRERFGSDMNSFNTFKQQLDALKKAQAQ
ncbi:VirD4-like conjugal transfer protein, CD1115 family [Limosilactobacillus fermentum]|uniref:VirD4-like conjugal transfer protein, CD1115 family n=1 Tax=Limosilactobacillus fermentum TaxID=1613 RepID=UPI00300549EC